MQRVTPDIGRGIGFVLTVSLAVAEPTPLNGRWLVPTQSHLCPQRLGLPTSGRALAIDTQDSDRSGFTLIGLCGLLVVSMSSTTRPMAKF